MSTKWPGPVGDTWQATTSALTRSLTKFDLAGGNPVAVDDIEAGLPEDLVNLFGTSGTTSFPKLGAQRQVGVATHARNAADALGLDESDVVLAALPFCGTFGFMTMVAALLRGARVVFLPHFQLAAAAAAVRQHGVTTVIGTNEMLGDLLENASGDPQALASLRRGAIAVMEKTHARPWRMHTVDFLRGLREEVPDPAPGRLTEAPWDDDLARTIREHGESLAEEHVAEDLLGDLDAAAPH